MMNDMADTPEPTSNEQMDPTETIQGNFEYRLRRLEDEKLPHRVTHIEYRVDSLAGEVVAFKEIARSIGVKVDSGISGLEKTMSSDIDKIQLEQAKNQSFIKGIVWVGGAVVAVVAMAPSLGEALKKLLGV